MLKQSQGDTVVLLFQEMSFSRKLLNKSKFIVGDNTCHVYDTIHEDI